MAIDQVLQGRRVLIVHEDDLRRIHLGRIIRNAGAVIAGPVDDYTGGISLLDGGPPIHAMVISRMLPRQDAVALLDAATDRNVRAVIVHPKQVEMESPFSDYTCLEAHVAGFRIVQAIADVLAITRGCIHQAAATSA